MKLDAGAGAAGAARRLAAQSAQPVRVYRSSYPCTQRRQLRTIEAQYPPYLPRQLLVFGRGYLPNARQIELPMGSAPAQSYLYSGPTSSAPSRTPRGARSVADFPQLTAGKHFAFNWGTQKAASGNEMYSVGLYELLACPPPGTLVPRRTF